jgi:hypothetical protein
MDRDFEKFIGGPNEAVAKRVHVTLSPLKLIRLNRNLYNLMGKPDAVQLGYSRTRDTIAIEPASPRLNTSFPVIPSGGSWRINAAPFCRHFNIRVDTTLKFVRPDLVGHDLYLKLSETVSVGGRKRKKK